MNKGYLLDTHVWIWLMNGDKSLKKNIIDLIRRSSNQNELFVASITFWEVAMLEARGRIALGSATQDWIKEALATPGLSTATLTPDIAIDSCHLPDQPHKDPADRIIIATARKLQLTLITRDERILHYGEKGYVSTLSA